MEQWIPYQNPSQNKTYEIGLSPGERPVIGECHICLHGLAYRRFRLPTDWDNVFVI